MGCVHHERIIPKPAAEDVLTQWGERKKKSTYNIDLWLELNFKVHKLMGQHMQQN